MSKPLKKPTKKALAASGRTIWLQRLVAAVLGLSYGLAVYSVLKTNVVPARYLYILLPLSLLVAGLLVWLLLRRKFRSKLKTILLLLASLLVIAGSLYGYRASSSLTNFFKSIQNTASKDTGTDITKPYVIYISGIDSYGDINTVSRSDVNILAVVNPKTKQILLVNTPRDYYVQLHGTTGLKDKLTHAGTYGIDMSKNTIQDLYQTKVDYTVRINFSSLLKLIDVLGGVQVNSDEDFYAGGYHFKKGVNILNSKQALAFSRERHSFASGDRQRGKNQQRVLEAIVSRAGQPDSLLNYQSILGTMGNSFQTNASSTEISNLVKQQLGTAGQWQSQSISVDGAGAMRPTYTMGSQPLSVILPDQNTVQTAISTIRQYQSQQ